MTSVFGLLAAYIISCVEGDTKVVEMSEWGWQYGFIAVANWVQSDLWACTSLCEKWHSSIYPNLLINDSIIYFQLNGNILIGTEIQWESEWTCLCGLPVGYAFPF